MSGAPSFWKLRKEKALIKNKEKQKIIFKKIKLNSFLKEKN